MTNPPVTAAPAPAFTSALMPLIGTAGGFVALVGIGLIGGMTAAMSMM